MTSPRPPRARRRTPGPSLPRPGQAAATPSGSAGSDRASISRHREHHVKTDYSYVHRDLVTIAVVGVVVIAFIVAMSFIVS